MLKRRDIFIARFVEVNISMTNIRVQRIAVKVLFIFTEPVYAV